MSKTFHIQLSTDKVIALRQLAHKLSLERGEELHWHDVVRLAIDEALGRTAQPTDEVVL